MRLFIDSAVAIILVLLPCLHANGQMRKSGSSRFASGSVCIAPAEPPHTGEKSLSNPAGGNRISSYSIQVDKKPPVTVSNDSPVEIAGLAIGKKHLIKIYGDGKLMHSFRFRFENYSDRKLCLWFKSLYETWSLWEARDAGAKCKCQ